MSIIIEQLLLLVSCTAKLLTNILNKRICAWTEKNDNFSDAQYDFRNGKSTTDAIFILHSIVEHILTQNKQLFCALIDLRKAFDSVYRHGLWYKLYKFGIGGKMLRIIRSMYESVKSSFRHCNNYSDFFDVCVGLRQGEVISPVLFSLFIEDLELYQQSPTNNGLTLNDITLILLLFADDMVTLGNSQDELQNSLNKLSEYCRTWSLEVNTN